jgi:hypothetical protein
LCRPLPLGIAAGAALQAGSGDVDQIYAAIAGDLTGSRLLE